MAKRESHPYSNLPEAAFWRTAVSEKSPLQFTGLYKKKFEIDPAGFIATAGSCFAQHISRHLVRNGFGFKDFEPAPPFLPEAKHATFGYGVFSARYANIYTARQLLQTFQRAFGTFHPRDKAWEDKGRFFDPFRPAIEPGGFASRDETEHARLSHLAAVRQMFSITEVLVFTFGLTEAWMARSDGAVYPACPGTIAGRYDAAEHMFHNFTAAEILADFEAFLRGLRDINPSVRLILTVSPVPLTATASGKHVLAASSYSKSVLRAVAGQLADSYDFIDYFPSYELVATHPMRAMFFEPNLRSVAPQGVEMVMKHFFGEHRGPRRGKAPSPKGNAISRRPSEPSQSEDDVVCEEMLLDQGL